MLRDLLRPRAGDIQHYCTPGKTLPPFPGDNSSETTGDGSSPTASEPVPTMMAAVRAEADRIIAAAASSGTEGAEKEAKPASVSGEGVAETMTKEGSSVASEAAVSQQSREEGAPAKSSGASKAVVNAVAVEHIQTLDTQAAAEALESDPELLRVLAMPELEAAVRAKCLLLFPKKEKERDPAALQRSNSI